MIFKKIKLGQIAKLNTKNISKNHYYKYINYLDTSNLTKNKILNIQRFDIDNAPSRAKRLVDNKDILYSSVRPNQLHYGILDNIKIENLVVSTGFNVIKCENDVNPYFIYYYIIQNEITEKMQGIAENSTTTYPSIRPGDLENIDIMLPEKKEQDKIAHILYKLDKKIETNNQTNNNLQELILTLYKKFIEDNSEAEEVTLEDCVKKIGTGADAIQRAPIVDYDTGIRCIRVGDMTNNRKCYEWGFAKMTDKDFNNYKLDIGDIVITRTAVNGLSYLIEDSMNIVCNNGLIRLKVNEKYNPLYIYLTMKTKDFYNYIHRIDSETSVRPNMKVDYLTSYKIKKISLEKQNQFCNMIKSMRQRQKEIEYENNNLTQLRDTLLPKLMNGEIDLDNIEI